ncbi:hypothetical protein JZO70_01215 [Enterococcus sp. 669A]|uniref:Uncharacterized protein n=1 Tax=Candidatus Enterococcus moelleringii TaxID=2815325 RepID=A0ABS3L581_9ENTE|nr:hypothetical protein [Enterococcus sp. 669A]MBO1304763.1 hypothetical protein [Enterococcus sp. 669A]
MLRDVLLVVFCGGLTVVFLPNVINRENHLNNGINAMNQELSKRQMNFQGPSLPVGE